VTSTHSARIQVTVWGENRTSGPTSTSPTSTRRGMHTSIADGIAENLGEGCVVHPRPSTTPSMV
jgi:hypothetical protein